MKKILLLFPLLLGACASGPYAIIDGSRSDVTDANSHDVVITGIDGQMYFDGLKIRNVEPGHHVIRLATTRADRKGNITYNTVSLETKPCTRYLLAADHARNLEFENRHWEVKVLREEPVAGCRTERQS